MRCSKGRQNVCGHIDVGVVHQQDALITDGQHVADSHNHHDNQGRCHAWDRDIPQFLELICAVHLHSFI